VGIETGIRAATLGTRVTRSVQLWRLWGPSVFDPLLLLKAWLSFFSLGTVATFVSASPNLLAESEGRETGEGEGMGETGVEQ